MPAYGGNQTHPAIPHTTTNNAECQRVEEHIEASGRKTLAQQLQASQYMECQTTGTKCSTNLVSINTFCLHAKRLGTVLDQFLI